MCPQAFDSWNKTELDSFLIEITANILKYRDADGQHLLPKIRDSAGQKGTGKWTAISALEYGTPVTLIGKRRKACRRGSAWFPSCRLLSVNRYPSGNKNKDVTTRLKRFTHRQVDFSPHEAASELLLDVINMRLTLRRLEAFLLVCSSQMIKGDLDLVFSVTGCLFHYLTHTKSK